MLGVRRPLDLGKQRRDVHGHHGGSGERRDGHVRRHHRVRGHHDGHQSIGGVRDATAGQHGCGRRGHGGGGQRSNGGPGVQRGGSGLREAEREGERQPSDGHRQKRRSRSRFGLESRGKKHPFVNIIIIIINIVERLLRISAQAETEFCVYFFYFYV